MDALDQLAPQIPALTKADFPPEEKLSALVENIQRRGHDLLDMLQPKDATKETNDFRAKLMKNLHTLLRGVSGVHGLFVDVGMEDPIDLAITRLDLPTLSNGEPRQEFGADENFILNAVVQTTGKDANLVLKCAVDKAALKQSAEGKAAERVVVPFEIDCRELKLGALVRTRWKSVASHWTRYCSTTAAL